MWVWWTFPQGATYNIYNTFTVPKLGPLIDKHSLVQDRHWISWGWLPHGSLPSTLLSTCVEGLPIFSPNIFTNWSRYWSLASQSPPLLSKWRRTSSRTFGWKKGRPQVISVKGQFRKSWSLQVSWDWLDTNPMARRVPKSCTRSTPTTTGSPSCGEAGPTGCKPSWTGRGLQSQFFLTIPTPSWSTSATWWRFGPGGFGSRRDIKCCARLGNRGSSSLLSGLQVFQAFNTFTCEIKSCQKLIVKDQTLQHHSCPYLRRFSPAAGNQEFNNLEN